MLVFREPSMSLTGSLLSSDFKPDFFTQVHSGSLRLDYSLTLLLHWACRSDLQACRAKTKPQAACLGKKISASNTKRITSDCIWLMPLLVLESGWRCCQTAKLS